MKLVRIREFKTKAIFIKIQFDIIGKVKNSILQGKPKKSKTKRQICTSKGFINVNTQMNRQVKWDFLSHHCSVGLFTPFEFFG